MNVFRLVFSNYLYIVLSVAFFIGLLIPLLYIAEYLFFEPFFIAHLPAGDELGFSLIVILSVLAAVVLPMNIYRVKMLRGSKRKMGSGIFGSIIGAAAGACSCGPIGFAVISTFGSVGSVASAFLTNYEIPIRVLSIAILVLTLYTTKRSLNFECKVT